MKHLKSFENKDNTFNLKKYIIFEESNKYFYYILKTDKYFINQYGKLKKHCKVFYEYTYNRQTKELKKENKKRDGSISIDDRNLIIFQSDNIQDCIDMIYTIENAKKYNL